jgi:biopolymer transport protein ExbD
MAAALHTAGSSPVLATPNVTPMIDVMLVVLIIFMLATPAIVSSGVQLPPGLHAVPRPEEVADRTLTIDAAGTYTLNAVRVGQAELPALLRRYVAEHPQDHVLYLRADRGLEYRLVREAMHVASENGIAVVGMVTDAAQQARRRASR